MDTPLLRMISQDPMLIAVSHPSPEVIRIAVAGELDLATGPVLGLRMLAAIDRHHPASVDLDLAEVTFLDCSGIGVLVTVRNAAHRAGCQIWISRPQPMIARILTVLGLLAPFTAPAVALRRHLQNPDTAAWQSQLSNRWSTPAIVDGHRLHPPDSALRVWAISYGSNTGAAERKVLPAAVFPGWIPILGGRSLPTMCCLVPGTDGSGDGGVDVLGGMASA